MTAPSDRALIEESLSLAADRCGDLTARVYARLFDEQPAMETLFWRDADGKIRGEMLARAFEAILDFIGERHYADNMIRAEIVTHSQYDVPPDVFRTFFAVVAATVKDAAADGWTQAMEAAWARLLAEMDGLVEPG